MASIKDFQKRIEKLEEFTKPERTQVVIMKSWASGRLIAMSVHGRGGAKVRLLRLDGESEQQLYDRVLKEAEPFRIVTGPRPFYSITVTEEREPTAAEQEALDAADRRQAADRSTHVTQEREAYRDTYTRRPEVTPEVTPDIELEDLKLVRGAGGAQSKPHVEIIETKRQDGPTAGHWMMG